jgi:hypothetical protein
MPSRIKKRFLPKKKFDRIDCAKIKNQTRRNLYDKQLCTSERINATTN